MAEVDINWLEKWHLNIPIIDINILGDSLIVLVYVLILDEKSDNNIQVSQSEIVDQPVTSTEEPEIEPSAVVQSAADVETADSSADSRMEEVNIPSVIH